MKHRIQTKKYKTMDCCFYFQEKDIVDKRIERMQRKVEGSPNVETMLVAVRELRKEREKVKELQTQKTEQRTAICNVFIL